MYFYSIAVMSFFVFFCHIIKNIHQDDVDDNKVIKKVVKCHYCILIRDWHPSTFLITNCTRLTTQTYCMKALVLFCFVPTTMLYTDSSICMCICFNFTEYRKDHLVFFQYLMINIVK